jgi:hypothetical protein
MRDYEKNTLAHLERTLAYLGSDARQRRYKERSGSVITP